MSRIDWRPEGWRTRWPDGGPIPSMMTSMGTSHATQFGQDFHLILYAEGIRILFPSSVTRRLLTEQLYHWLSHVLPPHFPNISISPQVSLEANNPALLSRSLDHLFPRPVLLLCLVGMFWCIIKGTVAPIYQSNRSFIFSLVAHSGTPRTPQGHCLYPSTSSLIFHQIQITREWRNVQHDIAAWYQNNNREFH